jgi:hypothetical protein
MKKTQKTSKKHQSATASSNTAAASDNEASSHNPDGHRPTYPVFDDESKAIAEKVSRGEITPKDLFYLMRHHRVSEARKSKNGGNEAHTETPLTLEEKIARGRRFAEMEARAERIRLLLLLISIGVIVAVYNGWLTNYLEYTFASDTELMQYALTALQEHKDIHLQGGEDIRSALCSVVTDEDRMWELVRKYNLIDYFTTFRILPVTHVLVKEQLPRLYGTFLVESVYYGDSTDTDSDDAQPAMVEVCLVNTGTERNPIWKTHLLRVKLLDANKTLSLFDARSLFDFQQFGDIWRREWERFFWHSDTFEVQCRDPAWPN